MNLLFAYFDPSAGSMLVQALVGGAGGLLVFGRYICLKLMGRNSKVTTIPGPPSNYVFVVLPGRERDSGEALPTIQ